MITDTSNKKMKIGVVLPMGDEPPQQEPPLTYLDIRTLAVQAEEAGFDSIWLYDHLLMRFPDQPTTGLWECWTLLAALAEATKRVEIGALVLCTAFRNPAVLAKMAATLDAVSDGRLILGIGAGWHKPEFDAFGIPFDHKGARFEEALHIITQLLRKGYVDFQGKYYSAPDCALLPRGPRPEGPPILVGAFRPRLLRLTARHADMWNTCWLGQSSALVPRQKELVAACEAEGRDPATLAVTVGIVVRAPNNASEEKVNPDRVLAGSAAQVAEGLHGYASLGVSHLICSVEPINEEALAWFSEVLHLYQGR